MRLEIIPLALITSLLLTVTANAQSYCSPGIFYQPQPPVVFCPPVTVNECRPMPFIPQDQGAMTYRSVPLLSGRIVTSAPGYIAPQTYITPSEGVTLYSPGHTSLAPGYTLRPPTQTIVTIINLTERDLSLWVIYIDQRNMDHKSPPFFVRKGAKHQIGQMAESPKMFSKENLAIAVRSVENKGYLKGGNDGTPLDEIFYRDCGDGTIAVGLALK